MIWKEVEGFPLAGEKHHASLLTDQQYAAIVDSTESHQIVADKFGIKRSTVAGIRRRAQQRNK